MLELNHEELYRGNKEIGMKTINPRMNCINPPPVIGGGSLCEYMTCFNKNSILEQTWYLYGTAMVRHKQALLCWWKSEILHLQTNPRSKANLQATILVNVFRSKKTLFYLQFCRKILNGYRFPKRGSATAIVLRDEDKPSFAHSRAQSVISWPIWSHLPQAVEPPPELREEEPLTHTHSTVLAKR